jgi:5'-methylthioadenosine phosphorylase
MDRVSIGVIGGSGLTRIDELTDQSRVAATTPFGAPSDEIVVGTLAGRRVAFLPRHGRGHRLLPAEVPYRANIYALRQLGVEHLISVSAVGSLREEIAPGHLCLPDQFIDLTRGRERTFFGDGIVGHVPFDTPVCAGLAAVLLRAGTDAGAVMHAGGTYVCIEGPQFSTLAESRLYRSWGAAVIGMTNLPEARLAREAEMCYATIALATDYDCWHGSAGVSVEQILAIIAENVSLAQQIIRRAVPLVPASRPCGCASALAHAIVTDPDAITPAARERLEPLIGRYLAQTAAP